MSDKIYRPVTSYDVAKLAGVSQSAVSRAFTPGGKVAKATREKIEQAAKSLGYRPSFIARSLITRRSNLVGVVVPGLMNPFYATLLDVLAHELHQMGYRALLFSMYQDDDTDPILEEILRHRVEALVLVSTSLSSHFAEECQQNGLPVLLINRKNDSQSVSSVTSDNHVGGAEIADYLLDSGHQQLAFIAGRESSSTSRDREEGFNQRLLARSQRIALREHGGYTLEGAMAATRRLMDSTTPPEGIFCANDIMAIGAINVLQGELGLKVGRDVSVIGYDNIAMAAWPLFNLTTYSQPMDEMVAISVKLLAAWLSGEASVAAQHRVKGALTIRGSVRPLAAT